MAVPAARQLPGHTGAGRDHPGGDGSGPADVRFDRAVDAGRRAVGSGQSLSSVGQFTAHKVEQILIGKVAPEAVPIETLKRFSYQIRISVAEKLKLPPPLPMFNYAEILNDAPIAQ